MHSHIIDRRCHFSNRRDTSCNPFKPTLINCTPSLIYSARTHWIKACNFLNRRKSKTIGQLSPPWPNWRSDRKPLHTGRSSWPRRRAAPSCTAAMNLKARMTRYFATTRKRKRLSTTSWPQEIFWYCTSMGGTGHVKIWELSSPSHQLGWRKSRKVMEYAAPVVLKISQRCSTQQSTVYVVYLHVLSRVLLPQIRSIGKGV